MKIYLIKRIGKKNGKSYIALICDVGYREVYLTFDRFAIADITGYSNEQFYGLKDGDKILIAELKKVGK